MAGATPREAVQNFIRPLREVFACLTTAVIVHQGQYALGIDYALTLNAGAPITIRRASRPGSVAVRVSQQYRIVEAQGEAGPYKVQTRAYMYSVESPAMQQEILSYHWHPSGPSPFKTPHLHLTRGVHEAYPDIVEAHLPTGRISIEEFLRFAIETFRLRTRRDDWRSVVNRTQATFRKWQTWA